jgi:para-aminobenzoate synthetase component 1
LAVVAALADDVDVVVVRDGPRTVVAVAPSARIVCSGAEALAALDHLGTGWWAGWLAYDLGRAVESVKERTVDDLGVPDLALARFDARLVFEPCGGAWDVTCAGEGPAREILERALGAAPTTVVHTEPGLGPWRSSLDRPDFEAGVRAVVEMLRSGECYQVNLTRRLECDREADPVSLYGALALHNPSPHAALVRLAGWSVVSASPELFLRRDGDIVETRPIKGTAPDAPSLLASAKDRAENVMIVDLARNDLGRVCEYGSITVPDLCGVERHPGLHHLVSTVRGRLAPGTTTGSLIAATFPPASVTGAPKPRVLQAIEDLEPVRRGVYCGAVGWIDETACRASLNVAIRTFTVGGGRTLLGVGAGIVADSDPAAEWDETELKAARLLHAAGLGAFAGTRS